MDAAAAGGNRDVRHAVLTTKLAGCNLQSTDPKFWATRPRQENKHQVFGSGNKSFLK